MNNQKELRDKLAYIIDLGLSATSISKATHISRIDLSRFKNEQIGLVESDAEKLKQYLDKVTIPDSI